MPPRPAPSKAQSPRSYSAELDALIAVVPTARTAGARLTITILAEMRSEWLRELQEDARPTYAEPGRHIEVTPGVVESARRPEKEN